MVSVQELCVCVAMTFNAHAGCNLGCGATVARLIQDQKVGTSNLSALIFLVRKCPDVGSRLRCATMPRAGAVAHTNNQTNAKTSDRNGNVQIFSLTLSEQSYRGCCILFPIVNEFVIGKFLCTSDGQRASVFL